MNLVSFKIVVPSIQIKKYHNFERNEIHATGFLKWTDFSWLHFLDGRNLKVLIVKWTGFTSSMVYWDEWPLVMIRASHHSTSGSELLVSLLGTNLANWMAEVIPVFLDMVEISACSLSNWAFIRTRWPSRWYCPGSTKLNDGLGCLLAPEEIIETKFYHTWNLAINIYLINIATCQISIILCPWVLRPMVRTVLRVSS